MSVFSAIVIMVIVCNGGGMIDSGGKCSDGKPPIQTELHLLSGQGRFGFDDTDIEARARATEYLAVLKRDDKIIAAIPRGKLDDKTISLFWDQFSSIGKAMTIMQNIERFQQKLHDQ